MSNDFERALVRILRLNSSEDKAIVGVGFLVADRLVLTCAHVIKAADSPTSITLDFPLLPDHPKCLATIINLDKIADVAVLRLTEVAPIGTQPIPLVNADDLWGHTFRAFGFPYNYDDGVWASGKILARQASGWLQIEDTKQTGYFVQPGFSGGPVWDDYVCGVIGMVVAADTTSNVRAAFILPVATLLAAWAPLAEHINLPCPHPVQHAHLFISYRHNTVHDQPLANYLYQHLSAEGHEIFIDHSLRIGTDWLAEIDRRIQASDFLIVLLSKESADSEMVQAEIHRAHEYRRQQGHPQTLPVRMAYEGLLPYSIDAFLNPLQYIIWEDEKDNERVTHEILNVIAGTATQQKPFQLISTDMTISEDGRLLSKSESLEAPLPEFDPRFLYELEAPGGAMKPRDQFYIERDADLRLKREISQEGTTTTIRGSRQVGKSSLLVRGIQHARAQAKIVHIDLQAVDRDYLETPDQFLRYVGEFIVRKQHLDTGQVAHFWGAVLGPQDKLSCLMEEYVLPSASQPIILALDEADRLLETSFHSDFFALIRSWHNKRAWEDVWCRLNIVLAISTEPYLLIADNTQSPFNVGLKLLLDDFNTAQVKDLNQRYGNPISENHFKQFYDLLGGHPYLTRKALYTFVTDKPAWQKFVDVATHDQGPFGDHLRRQLWLLRNEPALRDALKQIIRNQRCSDENSLFRLLKAGLVKGSGDQYACRCELYTRYFQDKLT